MKHVKILRILTILLALSLAIVSIAGAFFPVSYARDSASMGAQGVGQDLVDLFVAVPLLLLSVYLIVVALIFYLLWLKSIVPALIHNEVPGDVSDYDLLVNPVHVIDLVFAIPGLIIGAVLFRKIKTNNSV